MALLFQPSPPEIVTATSPLEVLPTIGRTVIGIVNEFPGIIRSACGYPAQRKTVRMGVAVAVMPGRHCRRRTSRRARERESQRHKLHPLPNYPAARSVQHNVRRFTRPKICHERVPKAPTVSFLAQWESMVRNQNRMTIPAEYRKPLPMIGPMGVGPPVSTTGTRCPS